MFLVRLEYFLYGLLLLAALVLNQLLSVIVMIESSVFTPAYLAFLYVVNMPLLVLFLYKKIKKNHQKSKKVLGFQLFFVLSIIMIPAYYAYV